MTAMIATNTTLWGVTLGIGAVVLLIVLALLSLLYSLVRGIDTGVASLIDVGGAVGANTAKINDLTTTALVLNQIKEEALIHDAYLSRQ
ncbi:MAG: hypothetical protein ACR2ML_02130 [Solirubrobacteraceae bacterium]